MEILVTGARGFIGRHLVPALLDAGHRVRAGTRSPDGYDGPAGAVPVAADVTDRDALAAALEGCDAVYYLVHAMEGDRSDDFRARDRRNALAFADAVRAEEARAEEARAEEARAEETRAGPGRRLRVVYLGGMDAPGGGHESPHLASRLEIGEILRERCDAVELRAAVVIGAGGSSYEMLRALVERLPVLVTPSWARSRTQPIALRDALRYLVAALDLPAGHYDIAGPTVLTYEEMLDGYAAVTGRSRPTVPVPGIPEELSARAVAAVTGQPLALVAPLVDSLRVDVWADDARIRDLVPFDPLPYDEQVRAALAQAEETEDAA